MNKEIFYEIIKFIILLLLVFVLIAITTYILMYYAFNFKNVQNVKHINNKETFSSAVNYTSSVLIYTPYITNSSWINSNIDTRTQVIYNAYNSNKWNSIVSYLNRNNSRNLIDLYNNSSIVPVVYPFSQVGVIMDTFQKTQINTQLNYTTTAAPQGYFIAFSSPQFAMTMDCSLDLENKNIGYFNHIDGVFIDAVLNGHRILKDSVNKVLINESDVSVLSELLNRNIIDICMTYIIPGSDFHKTLLKQRITFMGFSNMDIARVTLFYPGLTMQNNINIRQTFLDLPQPNNIDANTATVTNKENITNLPTVSQILYMFTPSRAIETFITRLELPNTYLDPTYSCYGDLTDTIKASCESPYDILGKPKKRTTTWDHPCTVDTDCPYYQANKNYPNTRGGCTDTGVCELPIGVKRVSYRKYDDVGIYAPYCYGCDAYDTTCCEQQQKPDYAFANDTNDRNNSQLKLPTYIHMNN